MSAADGGPAFPHTRVFSDSPNDLMHQHLAMSGMSLRDYFAAKAMAAVVVAIMPQECHRWTTACFAQEAYAMADAMLAERAK